MTIKELRHSDEETARRGDELYEKKVREHLQAGSEGRIVAIDVESGSYALADTAVEAARLLRIQQPQAEIWFVRVGHRALHRIGLQSSAAL